jgi:IMP cyclohydrolase
MNIDERLEKLVERHEALAQSVELMTMNINKHESNLARLEKIVEDNSKTIGLLARYSLHHEDRLNRLEGDNAA